MSAPPGCWSGRTLQVRVPAPGDTALPQEPGTGQGAFVLLLSGTDEGHFRGLSDIVCQMISVRPGREYSPSAFVS